MIHTRALVTGFLVGAGALPCQPVVQSYPRGAKAPAQWTLGTRPLLEIGGADAVGPAEFSDIVGVTRQADGTIIVADGTSRELRVFDPKGRFRKIAARRGQGPGELPNLGPFTSVGDTLVAIDGRQAVHVFAPDGAWFRSLILPAVPRFIVNPVIGALNGTDMVLNLRAGSMDSTATVRYDSIWFARISLRDTSVRLLGAQPLPPAYTLAPGGPATYPLIFAPRPVTAVRDGRVCLGYPTRYEVTCVDSLGRRTLEIRRDIPPRSVHDSARRAYRSRSRLVPARLEGSLRAHRERVAAAAQFAATFPAYSQLMLARTGELWVRAFVTEDGFSANAWRSNAVPSHWSIYDRQGRWVADCRLPARFAPAEAGADYVLGVSRDDDDVERITLWPLRR
jgi:hypothetical protein